VSKTSDFLKLENAIRYLLKCQGPTCSFFKSAEYAAIKIAVTHASVGNSVKNIDVPRVVYIACSPLVLYLNDDNKTIVIVDSHDMAAKNGGSMESALLCRNVTACIKMDASKKRKWKSDNYDDGDDGDIVGDNDDYCCDTTTTTTTTTTNNNNSSNNNSEDMISKVASECRDQKLSSLETKFLFSRACLQK